MAVQLPKACVTMSTKNKRNEQGIRETDGVQIQMIVKFQIKPTMQSTKTNCCAACLATVLGCSIDNVPASADGAKWDGYKTQQWLASEFGLQLVEVFISDETRFYPVATPIVCIISGKSPRKCKTGMHAVVAKLQGLFGFEMIHDPHESGDGIVGDPTHVCFFVPLRVSDVFMIKPKRMTPNS